MTISMLALAGIPATAGFIGKFYLIDAAVSGGYTWLGVVIVIGSMISLGLLPAGDGGDVDAPGGATSAGTDAPGPLPASGMPAIAGGSPELDDASPQPEVAFVAVLAGAATIVLGVVPQPLFNLVHGVGGALGLLAKRPPPQAASPSRRCPLYLGDPEQRQPGRTVLRAVPHPDRQPGQRRIQRPGDCESSRRTRRCT